MPRQRVRIIRGEAATTVTADIEAVENAMSGQLSTWQKVWIAQEIQRNPGARIAVIGLAPAGLGSSQV